MVNTIGSRTSGCQAVSTRRNSLDSSHPAHFFNQVYLSDQVLPEAWYFPAVSPGMLDPQPAQQFTGIRDLHAQDHITTFRTHLDPTAQTRHRTTDHDAFICPSTTPYQTQTNSTAPNHTSPF